MKLCRFELKEDPGTIRSGMVFSGKIYETDGAQAVAVHEADAVRPLAPIRLAPTLRIFRTDFQDGDFLEPRYYYGNPTNLVGASQVLAIPNVSSEFSFEPFVAVVLVSDAHRIDLEDADDIVLGVTLLNILTAKDQERIDRRVGAIGASQDFGGVIGPVLTTPEELDDNLIDDGKGRGYELTTVARVNGVERGRGNLSNLPFTFAEAIASASQYGPLHEGDVIAMGPIVDFLDPVILEPGDEVQIAVEKLGTLAFRLAQETL